MFIAKDTIIKVHKLGKSVLFALVCCLPDIFFTCAQNYCVLSQKTKVLYKCILNSMY